MQTLIDWGLYALWPLLIGTHLGALAYGYRLGWRHAVKADADVIQTQRREIEAYHREINDLIDHLPPGVTWNRPGVYFNTPDTQH